MEAAAFPEGVGRGSNMLMFDNLGKTLLVILCFSAARSFNVAIKVGLKISQLVMQLFEIGTIAVDLVQAPAKTRGSTNQRTL